MSLILSFLLATQQVAVPPEMLRCPVDRSVDASLCRALVAQDEERFSDSAEAFEEAASLATDDRGKAARALLASANMWLAANDATRAAVAIDKALAMDVLDSLQLGFAHLDRARAAQMAGNAALAKEHLERARTLVPDDPWVWYLGAGLALDTEDVVTARYEIERAIALAPDSGDVLLRAAAIEQAAGNADAAKAYLERARTAAPDSPAGRSARQLLQTMSELPDRPATSPPKEE